MSIRVDEPGPLSSDTLSEMAEYMVTKYGLGMANRIHRAHRCKKREK